MSRQRRSGALSVVLFSSLLSLSCSRPMTCALEGCKQDNGVVLADDFQQGASADATVQKDDLAQRIKNISDRLGASEALAALLQESVKLHDTRIKMLEDHAKSVDSRLADIDGMIEHHEEEIHAQAKTLKTLETSLNAKIEAQAALEKIALDELRAEITSAENRLKGSIESLDDATKESIGDILAAMTLERARVDAADAGVAKAAQDKLDGLQIILEGKITTLQGADTAIRLTLAEDIKRLDGRVDGVIKSTDREFRKLWNSFGVLQAQILLVAVDNILENQRIRREIDAVEALLRNEVTKLQDADKKMATDILDLYQKQRNTQTQLDTLEKNYNDFVKAQAETNKAISENYITLTGSVSDLKLALDKHMNTEAARVTDIVNALLPVVTSRITQLEIDTTTLQKDLDLLESTVGGMDFKALQTQHTTLRNDYNLFVTNTNNELARLRNLFPTGMSTCSITPIESNGNGAPKKVTLKCGNESITLTPTGH